MLNLSKYEQLTVNECWDKYGWGIDAKEDTTIYHRVIGEREIFVDELHSGYFCCEIYEPIVTNDEWLADSDDMTGQWYEETIEDAIRGAVVDSVAVEEMRKTKNCEDAVNAIAYKAYNIIFGETHLANVDFSELEKLLRPAREQVKTHGWVYQIKWQED